VVRSGLAEADGNQGQPPARRRLLLSINTSWNVVNFRAGLIRALVAANYEVTVATPMDAHTERLMELGCRHVLLPMDNKGTNPLADFGLFLRYHQIMRAIRPAVYLGWTPKPNIYGSIAARLLRIPTINNVSGLGTAFLHGRMLRRLVGWLYRLAFTRSRRVFFQNPDDRQLFVDTRLARPAITALLPGSGIDLKSFTPVPLPQVEGSPVFLLIGRLVGDKGIREFVDAARQVRRDVPGARFQVLGFLDVENRTAIARETVESWVAEGTIEYLGSADDVRPFIAAADCVVLPSYREGTPRTLLEAAAMGRPLVTTDVPGCRQVVEPGVNGFLCRPRDAESLAFACLQMVTLAPIERQKMGSNSRRLVEQNYDEQIVIASYLRTIEGIVAHEAPIEAA